MFYRSHLPQQRLVLNVLNDSFNKWCNTWLSCTFPESQWHLRQSPFHLSPHEKNTQTVSYVHPSRNTHFQDLSCFPLFLSILLFKFLREKGFFRVPHDQYLTLIEVSLHKPVFLFAQLFIILSFIRTRFHMRRIDK